MTPNKQNERRAAAAAFQINRQRQKPKRPFPFERSGKMWWIIFWRNYIHKTPTHLRLPQCVFLLCQTAPLRAKRGSQPEGLFLAAEVSLTRGATSLLGFFTPSASRCEYSADCWQSGQHVQHLNYTQQVSSTNQVEDKLKGMPSWCACLRAWVLFLCFFF